MTQAVPHLLAYISGHGFGHVAQVAPVLNELRTRHPAMQLTICSTAPHAHLQSRIMGQFTHIDAAADVGMVMASALDVLPQPSMAAYQALHHDWPARVAQESQRIAALNPDLLLSNVAYLPLLAARPLGIPCVAMCSLNWLDIFTHYCGTLKGANKIQHDMLEAYTAADDFLRITPTMPMTALPNAHTIAPIARIGQNRRDEINTRLQLAADEKLVLVSMGGLALRLPMERWPQIPKVRWLVQSDWQVAHPDAVVLESLNMGFIDLLASSDVLLCKPGYGSFAEAACNAIPVLYVAREDWPEEPYLIAWLEAHGRCRKVQRQALEQGNIEVALQQLLSQPKPRPVEPLGIQQAAGVLLDRLQTSGSERR